MKCSFDISNIFSLASGIADQNAEKTSTHIAGCKNCKRTEEEVRTIIDMLAPSPGEFDCPELSENVMTLIRLRKYDVDEYSRKNKILGKALWIVPSAMEAMILLAFAFFILRPQSDLVVKNPSDDPSFTARGDIIQPFNRWTAIKIYRSTEHGYQRVDDVITADDSIAFAYVNGDEDRRYSHLMVFAIDSVGEIFWYYPAYTNERSNPVSIDIVQKREPVQLPDSITHNLTPGKLLVVGLFSNRPLKVNHIENKILSAVKQDGFESLGKLTVDDAAAHIIELEVRPGNH